MFKAKYVDSIMMLVRLDLNMIVSLLQHKCEVSETVSTTTLVPMLSVFAARCPSFAVIITRTCAMFTSHTALNMRIY